jgi:hypothetical protein
MKKATSPIDDLLDEIAARYPQVQERQLGDIDADMLAKRRSIALVSASQILLNEWRAGRLDRVLTKSGKALKYVYRRKA